MDIPASLLERAKAVAAEEGTTLGRLVEDGLRMVIERHGEPVGFKLRSASFGDEGVRPGVDLQRWNQLRGLIYQGRAE